jgi:transposase
MHTQQSITNSQANGEQVVRKTYQRILLGLDVHADTVVVVRQLDNATPQPAQRFIWPKFWEWLEKQCALAEQLHSCYEAGPMGYGTHRTLLGRGVQNRVVAPRVLDEQGKRVNNDKTDALALCQRLDRYLAGNAKALAVIRVPTPEEEIRRIASRQREQFKREQKRLAAQGRSLLLTQGVRAPGPWWKKDRWAQLEAKLPVWLMKQLQPLRRILATVEKQLTASTGALEKAAPAVRPKGLGGLSHETIEREIGDWNRFNNRREVGSYTGLVAGVSASGADSRQLSITKHGNPRLRAALVELAWRWLIWQSQAPSVKRWAPILLDHQAPRWKRKKAIVALARTLAVELWRWRTGRKSAEELGWVMLAA